MLVELLALAGDGNVIAGFSAIVGSVITYFVTKRKTDATLTVDERKQLSLDEYGFRKSILAQLKICQESHQAANFEREECRKANIELARRITELETNCFSCLYRASGNVK